MLNLLHTFYVSSLESTQKSTNLLWLFHLYLKQNSLIVELISSMLYAFCAMTVHLQETEKKRKHEGGDDVKGFRVRWTFCYVRCYVSCVPAKACMDICMHPDVCVYINNCVTIATSECIYIQKVHCKMTYSAFFY